MHLMCVQCVFLDREMRTESKEGVYVGQEILPLLIAPPVSLPTWFLRSATMCKAQCRSDGSVKAISPWQRRVRPFVVY